MHCSVMEAAEAPRFWRDAALMSIAAENGAATQRQKAAERKARMQRMAKGR